MSLEVNKNIQDTIFTCDLNQVASYLCKKNKNLKQIIPQLPDIKLKKPKHADPFWALLRSIVYQQLSGHVAQVILQRFLELVAVPPHASNASQAAQKIRTLSEQECRQVGLSGSKIKAIYDLAEHAVSLRLPSVRQMNTWSDDLIIKQLTAVHGVGPWTVQMYLIFTLGRINVWPCADFGIQKGFMYLDGLDAHPNAKHLASQMERFTPYCSVASLYLWKIADLHKSFKIL